MREDVKNTQKPNYFVVIACNLVPHSHCFGGGPSLLRGVQTIFSIQRGSRPFLVLFGGRVKIIPRLSRGEECQNFLFNL